MDLVVKRFQLCKKLDDIYVATTSIQNDDIIAEWCEAHQINYFRGSEDDVLDRVVQTAMNAEADCVVQMGADSAYLDYQLIDELISIYQEEKYDYICNDMELTYSLGIYGHVVKVSKLIELNSNMMLSIEDREDVVRYIWEHSEEYNILNIKAPPDLYYPELRLTVDYPEELLQAKAVYDHFQSYTFTTRDIIQLYQQKPEMFADTKNLIQRQASFLSKGTGYEAR